jgi:hypothetical protein
MTMDFVLFELPSVQGRALLAVARVADPMSSEELVHGYIKQGTEAQAKGLLANMK